MPPNGPSTRWDPSSRTTAAPPKDQTATAAPHHVPARTALITYAPGAARASVRIQLSGVGPNSAHPVHIRSGQCDAPKRTLYTVGTLQSDDRGAADQTFTI